MLGEKISKLWEHNQLPFAQCLHVDSSNLEGLPKDLDQIRDVAIPNPPYSSPTCSSKIADFLIDILYLTPHKLFIKLFTLSVLAVLAVLMLLLSFSLLHPRIMVHYIFCNQLGAFVFVQIVYCICKTYLSKF